MRLNGCAARRTVDVGATRRASCAARRIAVAEVEDAGFAVVIVAVVGDADFGVETVVSFETVAVAVVAVVVVD